MAHELTPGELDDLLGAYALDAVDEVEREQVERYLATNAEARVEVARYRETASMLAFAGADAPSGLWDSIVASLEADPPRLEVPTPPTWAEDLPPLRLPVAPVAQHPADAAAPQHAGSVVDLSARRRNRLARIGAGLAAAGLLVVGVLGAQVARQGRAVDRLAHAFDREEVAQAAAVARQSPDARTVTLHSTIGDRAVNVVLLPDGTGYVMESNLPALPKDRTYQLWALAGDPASPRAISVGVLGREPATVAFRSSGPVVGFAVTAEAAPGVVSSEQQPVVAGTF